MRLVLLFLFASNHLLSQFDELVIERTAKSKKYGNTYRVYAELKSESDQLMVVFGDKEHPMRISSDKPFYQMEGGAASAAELVNNKREDALRMDSWITISSDDNLHPAIQLMGMQLTEFETNGGELSSGQDGAWYILPNVKQSVVGSNKRVLLAQLTTKGKVIGQLNLMGKTRSGEKWIEYNIPLNIK